MNIEDRKFDDLLAEEQDSPWLDEFRSAFHAYPVREPSQLSLNKILALSREQTEVKVSKKVWWSQWLQFLAPSMMSVMLVVSVASPFISSYFPRQFNVASTDVNASDTEVHGSSVQPKNFQPSFSTSEPSDFKKVAEGQRVGIQDNPLVSYSSSLSELREKFQQRKNSLLETDADSLFMKGRRYKTNGRIDLALENFDTLYHFYPDYPFMGDVLIFRAQCFSFLGEHDEALKSLEVYKKKYPAKSGLIQPMVDQTRQSVKYPSSFE